MSNRVSEHRDLHDACWLLSFWASRLSGGDVLTPEEENMANGMRDLLNALCGDDPAGLIRRHCRPTIRDETELSLLRLTGTLRSLPAFRDGHPIPVLPSSPDAGGDGLPQEPVGE